MPVELQVMLFTAISGAVVWLAKWMRDELKECKLDRAKCSADRELFHAEIATLHTKITELNTHLEHTDKKQVEVVKKLKGCP